MIDAGAICEHMDDRRRRRPYRRGGQGGGSTVRLSATAETATESWEKDR